MLNELFGKEDFKDFNQKEGKLWETVKLALGGWTALIFREISIKVYLIGSKNLSCPAVSLVKRFFVKISPVLNESQYH